MQYCEVTPKLLRGIVHLETVTGFSGGKLEYTDFHKCLLAKEEKSKTQIVIKPLYEYEVVQDCKLHPSVCYNIKVSLEIPENYSAKVDSIKEDITQTHREPKKLLYGFTKGKEPDTRQVILLTDEGINWTKVHFSCKNLDIKCLKLLSIGVKTEENWHILSWRLGIEFDKSLTYIDLKLSTLSIDVEVGVLNENKRFILLCKSCKGVISVITDFNALAIPSDFLTESIGSVYCEECQDDLPCNKVCMLTQKGLIYIGYDSITFYKPNDIETIEDRVCCTHCREELGKLDTKVKGCVSLLKNRIVGLSGSYDVFWRYSKSIEFIERIQLNNDLKISLYDIANRRNVLQIIKVSRTPDTFIFIDNNPVATLRVLWKSLSKIPDHSLEVEPDIYQHIFTLLSLFSQSRTKETELIPSLLPAL